MLIQSRESAKLHVKIAAITLILRRMRVFWYVLMDFLQIVKLENARIFVLMDMLILMREYVLQHVQLLGRDIIMELLEFVLEDALKIIIHKIGFVLQLVQLRIMRTILQMNVF